MSTPLPLPDPASRVRRRTVMVGLLAFLVMDVLLFGLVWRRRSRPASPLKKTWGVGISLWGGQELELRLPVPVQLQGDARWAEHPLGGTKATLAQEGCTLTCAAMSLCAQGYPTDPKTLNEALLPLGGFTESGLLIWKSIETLTKGAFTIKIDNEPTHKVLDDALKRGFPLIAKVVYQDRIWHWVLITGKRGTQYLMHDPLGDGTPYSPMSAYPRGIFAVRYLQAA